MFVSVLIVRLVFVKYITYRIEAKNEEHLLSCSKVLIKKETFTANHGSFPQDFNVLEASSFVLA